MSDVLTQLTNAGIRRAAAGEPMARHTSWRVGGPADYFCVVETPDQLGAAVQVACRFAIPWLVLGGGNNILVSDDGIEGLVILNRLRGLTIPGHDDDEALVSCGAGVFFAKAAHYTARHGYSGLEWGIAIPGTVGAGVVNNAGAHQSDVSRTLVGAQVIDHNGRSETLSLHDLAYKYRQSALKQYKVTQSHLVVTRCDFRICRSDAASALARVEELRRHRLATQPVKEASAGSTFKNPTGNSAGALIEQAGLKGTRIGGAEVSRQHANFIVNVGDAAAADIIALIGRAQTEVLDRVGIPLEPEVQFVGRWPENILRTILDIAA